MITTAQGKSPPYNCATNFTARRKGEGAVARACGSLHNAEDFAEPKYAQVVNAQKAYTN